MKKYHRNVDVFVSVRNTCMVCKWSVEYVHYEAYDEGWITPNLYKFVSATFVSHVSHVSLLQQDLLLIWDKKYVDIKSKVMDVATQLVCNS